MVQDKRIVRRQQHLLAKNFEFSHGTADDSFFVVGDHFRQWAAENRLSISYAFLNEQYGVQRVWNSETELLYGMRFTFDNRVKYEPPQMTRWHGFSFVCCLVVAVYGAYLFRC
jgi:hypothetical protein